MTFIANVTGDRTICVVADGGLEVASDVAGADSFRMAGGNLLVLACDSALEALGFRRTGEWRKDYPGAPWTAEVVQDERLRFQAALHRMRSGFLGAKDRLEELAGFQSASAENGRFFGGYRDAKRVFGDVLLQRDASGRAGAAEAPARPEGVYVTDGQVEATRMLVARDEALGREPDPAVLKIASAGTAGDPPDDGTGWAKIKRRQARDADRFAAVASGIGEYGIANACYRLAGILRRQAEGLEKKEN